MITRATRRIFDRCCVHTEPTLLRAVIKLSSRRNLVNVTRNMNYMAVVHVSEGSKNLSF